MPHFFCEVSTRLIGTSFPLMMDRNFLLIDFIPSICGSDSNVLDNITEIVKTESITLCKHNISPSKVASFNGLNTKIELISKFIFNL